MAEPFYLKMTPQRLPGFFSAIQPLPPLNGSDARERTQTSAREAPGAASGTERRLRSLRQIEQDLEELLQGPACCSDRAQSRELTRKILAHQESVRTSINRLENNTPDGPNCGPQNQPMLSNEMRADNEIAEEILDAQWNNMIGACTCDITRVFGFSFMSAQDDSLYINFQSIKDLLDSSDGGGFGGEKKWWNQIQSHSSSHEANEVFAVQNRWYNLMVANLCQKLKATPDPLGGGSLFDTSLICMFSENGESANHGQEDVAWYLLGGANGLINGGRVLHCDGRGTSDLLLEIARIMGLDWNTYGRSSGGLPGLKA